MAVTSCAREPGYPTTEVSLTKGGSVVTNHRDRYKIMVDNDDEVGEAILIQLPFLPYQTLYPGAINAAFLDKMSLSRDKAVRRMWYLDQTFSPMSEQEVSDGQIAPAERQPKWRWGAETLSRVAVKDAEGHPYATSAGQPIEAIREYAIPVLYIERFEETFDPNTIINYMNHLNSAEFWGAEPNMALMASIEDHEDAQEVFQGKRYRKVTYVIKFAVPFIADVLEGWVDLVLDHGTYYLDNTTNPPTKVPFKADSDSVTGNLDGQGGALDPGIFPNILRRQGQPSANFNDLNLGPW